MKLFANKSMWKKIVIIFLVINIFTFIAPKPVAAGFGGTLMEPICDFLIWTGDGIVNVIHRILIHQNDTLIKVDLNEGLLAIIRILVAIIAAVGVILLICGGGFAALSALAAALSEAGISMAVGAAMGSVIAIGLVGSLYVGAQVYSWDYWDNEVHIPLYSISPEEIFKGEIKLFNVDFFDSNDGENSAYTYDFVDMELEDLDYGSPLGEWNSEDDYNEAAAENDYPTFDLFYQDNANNNQSDNNTQIIRYYCILSDENGNQTIYKIVRRMTTAGPEGRSGGYKYIYSLFSI